jgi:arylsulfatase A-like enzyme
MESDDSSEVRSSRSRRLATLGALVPAGWLIHDLQRYLVSRDPAAFAELVPGSLVVVAAGALFGALAARSRWIPIGALLVAALFSVRHRLFADLPYSAVGAWAPRAAFALIAAFAAARLGLRWKLGLLRSGLALGAAAAAITKLARADQGLNSRMTLAAAGLALLLGWLRPAWLRRAATVGVVAFPAYFALESAWKAQRLRPDGPPPTAVAPAEAPNLLLIVLDTVRADHLAPYGYQRVTTPRIDAFVEERATRYSRARSAGTYTLPSHASLFTGLYPSVHGADHPRAEGQSGVSRWTLRPALGLRPDVPTLAEVLHEHGWRTAAIVANNAFLHHSFGLDRGFERYDDRDTALTNEYLALAQYAGFALRTGHLPNREGDEITAAALRWLDGWGARPFFLMLNYMDAHAPYMPQERHAACFSDERPADALHPSRELWPLLYDRSLLDLDQHVGELLDQLERRGLLENTAVIITADHGEALGEHDYWAHAWSLYEELVHVPLYVAPAALSGGRLRAVDDTSISGVAIPHLATRLVGLDVWPAPEEGGVATEWHPTEATGKARHWAAIRGRDLEADVLAWIEGDTKFIVAEDGQVEAYDLAADPLELAPLPLAPEERAAALSRARSWWAEHPPVQGLDIEFDEEQLERLRALGYLDG